MKRKLIDSENKQIVKKLKCKDKLLINDIVSHESDSDLIILSHKHNIKDLLNKIEIALLKDIISSTLINLMIRFNIPIINIVIKYLKYNLIINNIEKLHEDFWISCINEADTIYAVNLIVPYYDIDEKNIDNIVDNILLNKRNQKGTLDHNSDNVWYKKFANKLKSKII